MIYFWYVNVLHSLWGFTIWDNLLLHNATESSIIYAAAGKLILQILICFNRVNPKE